MEILDNIFPLSYQNMLRDTLLSQDWQWHYWHATCDYHLQNGVSLTDDNTICVTENTQESPQLVYSFYNDDTRTPHFELVRPYIHLFEQATGTEIKRLIRIKANLLAPEKNYPQNFHHTIHIDDSKPNHKSFLYYVNDCDGDTLFFDKLFDKDLQTLKLKHKQSPKQGTGVFFDSRLYHCSSPPSKTARVVINMVFENA